MSNQMAYSLKAAQVHFKKKQNILQKYVFLGLNDKATDVLL